MITPQKYVDSILSDLGFSKVEELIDGFFLYELVQSYLRIDKQPEIENKLRDRFIKDLYRQESITRKLMDKAILRIDWERQVLKNEEGQLGRTDIEFYLPGIEFILECKRLDSPSTHYINEGVQRFINCDYAENDQHAGMIGFIVGGDINSIIKGLKEKVGDIISNKPLENWSLSFRSSHLRENNTNIMLSHLFFEFKQSVDN